VTSLGNNLAAWIGDSMPTSLTNDLGLLKRNFESFNSCFGESDGVVCDGAYNQLQTLNPSSGEPWLNADWFVSMSQPEITLSLLNKLKRTK
jgi:hypothetical protein